MDDALDAVGVLVLDHDQARVAGGDAAAQRRLDGLVGVDGDHRRDRGHHLARLLLVQVEDAAEHPASPGSSVPPGCELSMICLQVLGGVLLLEVLGVDAEEPHDRVGDALSAKVNGARRRAEPVQRPRDAARGPLGAG